MGRYRQKTVSHYIWKIGKWVAIIVVVLLIGLFALRACTGNSMVQTIDKSIPSISDAPQQVFTVAGSYYAKGAVKEANGDIYMKVWWERLEGKWILHDTPTTLPYSIYGDMNITQRSQ